MMHDITGIFTQDIEIVYNQLFREYNGDFDRMSQRLIEMDKELENERIHNYYHEELLDDTLHKKYLTYSLVKSRIMREKLKKTMDYYMR